MGVTVRIHGSERGLNDTARHLVALDRAWTLAASVEAYQRGHQETWARQTQYAPRPRGLRIDKNSPTVVELWDAVDVPTIIAGTFSAFVYIMNNVEKIVTIPNRIAIARASSTLERLDLERRLTELESSHDEIVFEFPLENPPRAMPNEEPESMQMIEVDRHAEIERLEQRLDSLVRRDALWAQLNADLDAIQDRARSVQRDLERAEPEVIQLTGVAGWRARRRRSL